MNMHYCKLAPDCNWCNVPFCPYEKMEDDIEDEEIMAAILDDEEDE